MPSRQIGRSQTIEHDYSHDKHSSNNEKNNDNLKNAKRKKLSAAAIFNGFNEAANFMSFHNPTKKSSLSYIHWPIFSSTRQSVRNPNSRSNHSTSPQIMKSLNKSSAEELREFRPKRFSFALINRKKWFSTSTSLENNGRINIEENSRRTSTSELPAVTLSHISKDSPGTSAQAAQEEAGSLTSSSSSKRTSIRRFFSSNQSNKAGQHPRPTTFSNPAASAATQSQPSSSAESLRSAAAADNSQSVPSSVLSSVCQQPTTATSTLTSRHLAGAIESNRSGDSDLPPPMSQLNSTASPGELEEPTVSSSQAGTSTSYSMAGETDTNNAVSATEDPTSSSSNTNLASTPVEMMSSEESARLKRSYVIQELVESERTYVQDLTSIVEGYIGSLREMELNDEDREKIKIIFANIEQILDFHKTFFLKEIDKSLSDYNAAGNAFIKYERRLHTFYVKYCQNKPKSDFLVGQEYFEQLFIEIKDKLGHKVALSDLLIKPVQRITKYQLMLSDILKYTHRSGDNAEILENAHEIMRVVPKACDDMMQVGRLQGFQGNLNAQGRLIFQGTLCISDGGIAQPFKGKERRVFLFEQSVIIAECIPPRKEYGNPTYNFKNQIMVNKMMLDEKVPDEPLRFVLQSNDPNQQATYVAQSASAEDKEQWLSKLSAQLDQQKTFLAALVDPKRYQNQLANTMGSLGITGKKKDSSGSLGTPTSPVPHSGGAFQGKASVTQKSSTSKLFGFGKPKS